MKSPRFSSRLPFFAVYCLLVGAALALGGCSGGSESESNASAGSGAAASGRTSDAGDAGDKAAAPKKTVVTFWHAISGPHEKVIGELAEAFEATHPDVDIEPLNQGQYAQLKLKLNNALATDAPPTIAMVYEGWATEFWEADRLVVLQDFVDQGGDAAQAMMEDIYPAFIEGNQRDGKLISLPFNKSTFLVFYNKTMFDAAGYDAFPTTLEEMIDAARKLTQRDADGNVTTFGIGLRATLEPFTCLLLSRGGSYARQIDGQLRVIDTPEAEEALTLIDQLNNKEKVAFVDGNYMSEPFGSQRIAFYWGSSAGIPFVKTSINDKFEMGTASLPLAANEAAGFLSQGTNLAIFNDSTKAEQKAAWDFLMFLMRGENAALFSAKTGYLPIRREAVDVPILAEYIAANPPYQTCVNQMERLRFEPVASYWEQVRTEAIQELEGAYHGRKSVRESLERAEEAARQIIERAGN